MKKLWMVAGLVLMAQLAFAAKYYQAKLIFTNGKVLEGFARYHKEPAAEYILFRSTEEGPEREIASEELRTLIYFYGEGESEEYDRIRTWHYNLKKEKIVGPPAWRQVVLRGHVTLYTSSTMGTVVHSSRGASMNPGDTYYFVLRPGEESGTMLHLQMHTTFMIMKNRMFRIQGTEYFRDYKELSEKIANKEYKAKDLLTAVQEYNAWHGRQ